MNRHLPIGAIALVAAIAFAACSASTAAAPASHAPAATAPPASAVPSAPPSATPRPSAAPATQAPASPDATDTPNDANPIHVELANALGDDVSIDIQDESGHVVGATSGTPGDGASVAWRQLKAENVDARTIRFTWTGMAGDDRLGFYVSENGKVALVLQEERDGDAVAFDRILIVRFDRQVDAKSLTLGVQDGLDTAA